jgi:hypothetical protein
VPEKPALRRNAELRLIGRALPRRDIPGKTDGSAVFGLDFKLPGMVYAAVRQAPSFGGTVLLVRWAWSPGITRAGTARTPPPIDYDAFIRDAHRWIEAGAACPAS